MELQGSDAVPPVTFSRDFWSQDLQAVPGREACNDTAGVNPTWLSLSVDFSTWPTFSRRMGLAGVAALTQSSS